MKLYLAELLTGKSAIKNQTAGESSSCLAIVFLLDLSTAMKYGRPKLHKKGQKPPGRPAHAIMDGNIPS